MTTVFIILAIIFISAATIWAIRWNKTDEKIYVGGYAEQDYSAETIKNATIHKISVTDDVLFGKEGRLTKGETFYEGKIRDNSQLYIRMQVAMEGSVVFSGINDNVATPKLQIAVQIDDKQCIGNPCNSQRQSVQPYVIHNGESIWLSSDVLNGIKLPEYFVLRILYRLNNGEGYDKWQITDAINIHNR